MKNTTLITLILIGLLIIPSGISINSSESVDQSNQLNAQDNSIMSNRNRILQDSSNAPTFLKGEEYDNGINSTNSTLESATSNSFKDHHVSSLKAKRNDNVSPTSTPTYIDTLGEGFLSTWNTSLPGNSNSSQVKLPLVSSGKYDFVVDWGDGKIDTINAYDQIEVTHNYTSPGIYQINITGDIKGWSFNNGGDVLKLVQISQWGPLQLGNVGNAFYGASNLVLTTTDALNLTGTTTLERTFKGAHSIGGNGNLNSWNVSNVTNMRGMFSNTHLFNQSLNNWDTSNVRTMQSMFRDAITFNGDISTWDTSRVKNMKGMFSGATSFNQPIGNWNTSRVTSMAGTFSEGIFNDAKAFNQPLNNWDVSNLQTMWGMFENADSFNQHLDNWDTSNVTIMRNLFYHADAFDGSINNWDVSNVVSMQSLLSSASSFNQPLDKWDVSSVTNMRATFSNMQSFNQPIGNWNTSSVTTMRYMFSGAVRSSFNQPIDNWNTSNVTDMKGMFSFNRNFNQPIGGWDVSSVTIMGNMFYSADSFNQPLDTWNVSSVTKMSEMFMYASKFNQPLNNWDVSSVTNMAQMFRSANNFNQALDKWDVSSVTTMHGMFFSWSYVQHNFDQPIGSWNVSSVTTMGNMFSGTSYSTSNYDDLLIKWANLTLQSGVTLDIPNTYYTINASAARKSIINTYGWSFNDKGLLDTIDPIIDSPPDITYNEFTTGNNITWVVSDFNSSDDYYISLNGSTFDTGLWSNGTISINVDGLAYGTFNFTITIFDEFDNSATDTVLVKVKDISQPNINSPPNVLFDIEKTDKQITWMVNDSNPHSYLVKKNGTEYKIGQWSNGSLIVAIANITESATYNFTLVIIDQAGNSVYDTIMVELSPPTKPILSSPSDISVYYPAYNQNITWNVEDQSPQRFEILRNHTIVKTGSWSNGSIFIEIEGLNTGIYNFTLVVFDQYNLSTGDTVLVSILENRKPEVNSPSDIIYKEGETGNSIIWIVRDKDPGFYSIFLNGTVQKEGSWSNGTISIGIDGLTQGIYNYTIVVSDVYQFTSTDTVLVTVQMDSSTKLSSTTTTTSDTKENQSENELFLPLPGFYVFITIVLLGVAVKIRRN